MDKINPRSQMAMMGAVLASMGMSSGGAFSGVGIKLRLEDIGHGPKMATTPVISNGRKKREAAKLRNKMKGKM